MKIIKFSPIFGNNVGDLIISRVINEEMVKRGLVVDSYDWMMRKKKTYKQTDGGKLSKFQKTAYYLQMYTPNLFFMLKKTSYFMKKDYLRYSALMDGYDYVLIGGGNLLMDKNGSDYSFRVAEIIKRSKVGVSLVGVGAGPFSRARSLRYLETHISKCRSIWVRDNVSANWLRNTNEPKMSVEPDPAFLISSYFKISKPRDPRYLGLNLVGGHLSDKQMRTLADQVSGICELHDCAVKIINTAYPFDVISSREFLEMLPRDLSAKSHIVNLEESSESFKNAFSDLAFFLGSRMHSIIFAASYYIPVVGITWDQKVSGVLEMIYGERFNDFRLNSSADDFEAEISRVLAVFGQKEKFQHYAADICKLKARIEHTFDNLRKDIERN